MVGKKVDTCTLRVESDLNSEFSQVVDRLGVSKNEALNGLIRLAVDASKEITSVQVMEFLHSALRNQR